MVEFLPNPNPERSEWNYLSWHNQIIAPISFRFRSGIDCKVYHEVPIYLSPNLFLKEETPHLILTALSRLNRGQLYA